MLTSGVGIEADLAQAAYWYRNAAEQGLTDAQYNLAMAHFRGAGVTQDYVEVFKWFHIAASYSRGADRGQYAASRDAIATRLTPEQVSDARQRAQTWVTAFEKRPVQED